MAIKRYKAEQIVTLLRQIEVSIGNGKTTPEACNDAAMTVFARRQAELNVKVITYDEIIQTQANQISESTYRQLTFGKNWCSVRRLTARVKLVS